MFSGKSLVNWTGELQKAVTHLQFEKPRLGSERREQLSCKPSPATPNGTVSLLAFSAPVPSMDGWFNVLLTEPRAVIYALLCLLVSRIHAKEAGPILGSIERYDQAGRINIVPDFIFSACEPAHEQDKLCVELALPPRDQLFSCPVTNLQSLLNQGARC